MSENTDIRYTVTILGGGYVEVAWDDAEPVTLQPSDASAVGLEAMLDSIREGAR